MTRDQDLPVRLAAWAIALEAAGFDLVEGPGDLVGRRELANGVETLAVDRAGRILLTRTRLAGPPVSRTKRILGVEAIVVDETSQTTTVRLETPRRTRPAELIAAVLDAAAGGEAGKPLAG